MLQTFYVSLFSMITLPTFSRSGRRCWVNILWQLCTVLQLRVDLSVHFLTANLFQFITPEGKPGGSILGILQLVNSHSSFFVVYFLYNTKVPK